MVASRHLHRAEAPSGPLDVWLVDSEGVATRIATGSDWCLAVEESAPYAAYDMAGAGRVEVAPISSGTPFADHLGKTMLAVGEESAANCGRTAWEIAFTSGRVRGASRSGDLHLSSG